MPAPGYLITIPWELDALGGVSQVVLNLQRELGNRGWSPTVLVSDWSAKRPRFASDGPVGLIRWRIRSPWPSGHLLRGLIAFALTLPSAGWTLRRLARRHDWRVVNIHYPELSALNWIVLRRLGFWSGSIVLTVHGSDVREVLARGGWVRLRLTRLLLEGADAIVACAADLADDVARIAPAARDRVRVILNGVDASVLEAERAGAIALPHALPTGRFVLNVATFEPKKSQDVLIEAFARLAHEHADVDLVLVGRSEPWLEHLRSMARTSGVDARIHFLADLPHAQVLMCLARATVFCLPSRSEGHPLAILEAASFAIPVVATPVGAIERTIPDADHGLLVPVADVVALAGALDRLLGDPALADAIGRTLQRRVAAQFRWTDTAARYSELARRLGAIAAR